MVPPFSRRISPIKGIPLIPQYYRYVKGVTIEIAKNRGRRARFGAYGQEKPPGGLFSGYPGGTPEVRYLRSGAPLGHSRPAALAVGGDVAEDVKVGCDGGAAGPDEHLVLQDNGARGAVQGGVRESLPPDPKSRDGRKGVLFFP